MSTFSANLKERLLKIREMHPVIHHITNTVTINSCANVTSAMGASPIMAYTKEESNQVTALSSALVLNTGTPDNNRFVATVLSGKEANLRGIPIVLDPVGVGATDFRKDHLKKIMKEVHPSIIKGNLAEIKTLSGLTLNNNKAIDSIETVDDSTMLTLEESAKKFNCVVALTGKEDIITDSKRICRITRGTPMFTYISGAGCITSSVIGCFLAVEKDPYMAAIYALYTMSVCGEKAAAMSNGPADFYINLVNNLFNIHTNEIEEEGISFE